MCGIIGLVNYSNSENIIKKGLEILENRGKDNVGIISYKSVTFGHNLHAIIDYVKQPLVSTKGILIANCEIYNWVELNKKYALKAKNDADLIIKLIDKNGLNNISNLISELDGDFAIAYFSKKDNKLVLARDNIGVKPLVYSFDGDKIAFASEKKAFDFKTTHLNPRQILIFDLNNKKLKIKKTRIKKTKTNIEQIKQLLLKSVSKRIPQKKVALLLSGGIDSSLLGKILQNNKIKFTSYFAGISDFAEPKDLEFAKKVSYELDSVLKINLVKVNEFEKELPYIISLIESTDPVRVGIASTIYFATKNMEEKVCFSGLGADELCAGYSRFNESIDINKDSYSYLIKMYENDLYFEDIITMTNKTELRIPYLDKNFVSGALMLAPKYKKDSSLNKKVLREFAMELGLPKEFALRPKKAAQYGSNFDKALYFLARKNKFKSKADYLISLQKKNKLKKVKKNIDIAALISTGKDSLYAMQLMQKQGYNIKCLITIDSKNKDSFMFHTPTINLAKLQAKALEKPIIISKTNGVKETELKDLKKSIRKAKKEYNIEGIVSGALFSNYQRIRIEKICEQLGIRAFAPLWHMNQLKYLEQILNEKMKIMITKIACYGMDESWLGKILEKKDLEKLKILQKKYGVNVAGEGGEYESLVVDMPIFQKKLDIKFVKKMENEFTGSIKITKSKLILKNN